LTYISKEPVHRKYHHDSLTFSMLYAFTENFLLSLSHDEVVYGKGSLINKMPGDDWQKFANLRLLFGYLYTHPGKKLFFMGGEFAQWNEWNHDESLDWSLLQYDRHKNIQCWVRDLNALYRKETSLYQVDFDPRGFEWIDCGDVEQSVVSFMRKGKSPEDRVVVVCNFTPVTRYDYRLGVPAGGFWREIMNSDSKYYGGSGQGNSGGAESKRVPAHNREYSVSLTLPALSVLIFKREHNKK
jgi:1,4-alpha-glucan branching enzyme